MRPTPPPPPRAGAQQEARSLNAGRALREWRARVGLTQRELAERTGVPQPHIARIEGGHDRPRIDAIDRLLAGGGAGLTTERAPRLPTDAERSGIHRLLALPPAGRVGARRTLGLRVPQMIRVIRAALVECVAVGDLAAVLHGLPIRLREIELCLPPAPDNRRRLARAATRLLGPTVRDPERRVPARIETRAGTIRVARAGVVGYADLAAAGWDVELGGKILRVASLDDLITIAAADGDLERREALRVLRREIDRA